MMQHPWSPEIVITEESAAQIIEKQFPELKPININVMGKGFDNATFLVNNQYVFRFPVRKKASKLIEIENRLLPIVSELVPVTIPLPRYFGKTNGDYPWSFGGYKILKGNNPTSLTPNQRFLSVEVLAQFLRTLHCFPIQDAEKLVPYDQMDRMNIEKRKQMLESQIEKAKQFGFIQGKIASQLEEIFLNIDNPTDSIPKTLVHGDLHFRNLLVNKSGKITSVIDWGDSHIGHPAIDLSVVYSFLPKEARTTFFKLYGNVHQETKRIAQFKAIETTIFHLLFAYELKDYKLVEECKLTLFLILN
ncbi:phosphotransferase [Aquibacillus albus]|uniref:Aminoglycoside phosphotransferase (APT) family kinase protein n=1 Tax=Aquibacillus albus TaxID=1168171 RepID=A0ABS2N4G3_9BACI|nr:phosphotransferase [Aquibacillus albus]MBM7573037.1 aminoglycoside phosphotransferase (APT) family kinase protein [Aquibacillus albus]